MEFSEATRFGRAINTDEVFGTHTNLTTGASITASNNSNSGWLMGAGIEWAFAPNWWAKVEYNFLGLDDRTFIAPAGFQRLAGDTFFVRNRDIQTVKVGINYLVNWSGYGYGYGYGYG